MLDFSSIEQPSEELHERLRSQPITSDEPGPILRDFGVILDAMKEDGIRVSATQHHFYSKLLPEMNQRLARPVAVDFKRPRQKSYPNLHGLHLLLTATGMSYVSKEGAHHRRRLHEEAMRSWQHLNDTERYMALLEAWINRAGDDDWSGLQSNLYHIVSGLDDIPLEGRSFDSYNAQHDLRYAPRYSNLALMDLFGVISLEQGEPEPGEGWRIEHASLRPFGDALLRHLVWALKQKMETPDDYLDFAGPEALYTLTPDDLREHLGADFPDWNDHLTLPDGEFRSDVHVFKVTLGDTWRRIALPGTFMLDDLTHAILRAFNFDSDHLWRFIYEDAFSRERHVNRGGQYSEPPFTDETRVGDVPLRTGNTMTFLFDFGDHWEFDVLLERLDDEDTERDYPAVLDEKGEPPVQYPSWNDEGW